MPALTRLAYGIGNPSLASIGSPITSIASGGAGLSRLLLHSFRHLLPICGTSPQNLTLYKRLWRRLDSNQRPRLRRCSYRDDWRQAVHFLSASPTTVLPHECLINEWCKLGVLHYTNRHHSMNVAGWTTQSIQDFKELLKKGRPCRSTAPIPLSLNWESF